MTGQIRKCTVELVGASWQVRPSVACAYLIHALVLKTGEQVRRRLIVLSLAIAACSREAMYRITMLGTVIALLLLLLAPPGALAVPTSDPDEIAKSASPDSSAAYRLGHPRHPMWTCILHVG